MRPTRGCTRAPPQQPRIHIACRAANRGVVNLLPNKYLQRTSLRSPMMWRHVGRSRRRPFGVACAATDGRDTRQALCRQGGADATTVVTGARPSPEQEPQPSFPGATQMPGTHARNKPIRLG